MKILKIIGLGILGILVLILIIPVFLSSKTTVTRSAMINAPADSIYQYIANFDKFTQWSPWYEMEPTAAVTIEGNGLNSKYSWAGEKTGKGSMTIINLEPNKSVDIKLQFTEPFQSLASTKWMLEPSSSSTKITWEMSQDLSYMMRYMGLTMDGMVGKDFEKGLSNLKNKIEKK